MINRLLTVYLQLFVGILFLLLFAAGCRTDAFTSYWRDSYITIDGDQSDWQGRLWVPESENIAIGIMNDESNLYLTLSSSDRNTIMQVMRLGFTVWFDPKGGKKEVFGIKYPVGMAGVGMRTIGDRGRSRDQMPDLHEEIQSLKESQIWAEILGPEKDDIARIPVMDSSGIQVGIGYSAYGHLVYELTIPLERTSDSPHAIDTSPGATIGIGFETGKIDFAAMRRSRGGNSGMPGGMPGGRGRPGGMRGGGRPGGMRGGGMRGAMPEPFKYWARVTLATGS